MQGGRQSDLSNVGQRSNLIHLELCNTNPMVDNRVAQTAPCYGPVVHREFSMGYTVSCSLDWAWVSSQAISLVTNT
jgi:hypothetical protein